MINGPEANTLRRIALLVLRASEDCKPIHDDLAKIANVIDHMKRNLVLDAPIDKDAVTLSALVRQLSAHPPHANANCKRLCTSLMRELQELMPMLITPNPQRRRSVLPAA